MINKIICKMFGHKVSGDNFHGHYCSRCWREFDWGILEKYRKSIPYGTVIKIPKFGSIDED